MKKVFLALSFAFIIVAFSSAQESEKIGKYIAQKTEDISEICFKLMDEGYTIKSITEDVMNNQYIIVYYKNE